MLKVSINFLTPASSVPTPSTPSLISLLENKQQAFIPVLVHLMSWSIGLAHMDTTIGVILSLISVGCVIAALGELTFSTFGFICQGLAVVVSFLLAISFGWRKEAD
jgi:hypothetical protein